MLAMTQQLVYTATFARQEVLGMMDFPPLPGFQTIGASSFLPDGSHVLYLKRLGHVACGEFSCLLAVV